MILQKYINIMPDSGTPDLLNTDIEAPHNIIETHLAAMSAYNTRTGGILKMVHFQFLQMMGDDKSWQEIKAWFKNADSFLEEIEGV